jgi:heat shock protein HtpX
VLKRLLFFAATNVAVAFMLIAMVTLLGFVGLGNGPSRIPLIWIAAGCLGWGTLGALVSLLLSRWGAKRALRVRLIDGQTGDNDLDWLHATVVRLIQERALRMPELGVYASDEVNALSTGPSRKRALIAVSSGLLQNMSREEVIGVLGHEVAHIANGDMVTMSLLQGVLNAFVLCFARLAAGALRRRGPERVARWAALGVRVLLQLLLGSVASTLVAAFSRRREYRADAGGAAIAGRANVLAALRQLERTRERVDGSHPALSVYRIAGGRGWLDLLATHPPLARRIAALNRAQTA